MSDTVKIIIMVAFFLFFINKRRITSFLSDRRAKRLGKSAGKEIREESGTINGKEPVSSSATEETKEPVPAVTEKQSPPYRYEVYGVDYAQYPDTEHFADRISAKLDVIEMSMQDKKHYIKFVELGTLLLIVVKYRA